MRRENKHYQRRYTQGSVLLNSVLFIFAVSFIAVVTNDLHRGWTIISDLNGSADIAADTLVQGNFTTYQEQTTAIQTLLVNQERFITDNNQITIEWLNAAGGLLDTSDVSKTIPLYIDPAAPAGQQEDTQFLLDRVRVTIEYPIGSDPPFPNPVLNAATGEIPLIAQSERRYFKKSDFKHFYLVPRHASFYVGFIGGGFLADRRAICAGGLYSSLKDPWDIMCQEAAKLSEPVAFSNYRAALMQHDINSSVGLTLLNGPGEATTTNYSPNYFIETWNLGRGFTFGLASGTDTNCDDYGSNPDPVVIHTIGCYPEQDGAFIVGDNDTRYILMNNSSVDSFRVTSYDWNDLQCTDANCCDGGCAPIPLP